MGNIRFKDNLEIGADLSNKPSPVFGTFTQRERPTLPSPSRVGEEALCSDGDRNQSPEAGAARVLALDHRRQGRDRPPPLSGQLPQVVIRPLGAMKRMHHPDCQEAPKFMGNTACEDKHSPTKESGAGGSRSILTADGLRKNNQLWRVLWKSQLLNSMPMESRRGGGENNVKLLVEYS